MDIAEAFSAPIDPWREGDKTYRVEHRGPNHLAWTRFKKAQSYPSALESGIGGSYDSETAARNFVQARSAQYDKRMNTYRITTRDRVIALYAQGRDLTPIRRVVSV